MSELASRLSLERLAALAERPPALIKLRKHLVELGYTLDAIRVALGLAETTDRMLGKTALYASLLANEPSIFATKIGALSQLFFLSGRIPHDAYVEALPSDFRGLVEELGLIRRFEGGTWIGTTVTIVERDGRYFLSDRLFEQGADGRVSVERELVMPMHASSCELYATLTPHPGEDSLIDIGCGSGCLALLLAPRFRRVVGLDVDPRAVAFSRLNAALNEVDARFIVANALELEDMRHDRVISNIGSIPDFRAGAQQGNEMVFRFLERVESLLTPGGRFDLWCILFVAQGFANAREQLEHGVPTLKRFSFAVTPLPRSPFTVQAAQLEQGAVPRSCYLANDDDERKRIVTLSRERGIREILALTISGTLEIK